MTALLNPSGSAWVFQRERQSRYFWSASSLPPSSPPPVELMVLSSAAGTGAGGAGLHGTFWRARAALGNRCRSNGGVRDGAVVMISVWDSLFLLEGVRYELHCLRWDTRAGSQGGFFAVSSAAVLCEVGCAVLWCSCAPLPQQEPGGGLLEAVHLLNFSSSVVTCGFCTGKVSVSKYSFRECVNCHLGMLLLGSSNVAKAGLHGREGVALGWLQPGLVWSSVDTRRYSWLVFKWQKWV